MRVPANPHAPLLCLFLCATFTAFSQDAPAPASASPPGGARTARTVFFNRPAGIADSAVLAHGGGSIPIALPAMNLSGSVALPEGDIELAALPKAPDKEHPIPADAPRVAIPAAWRQVLLLFFPQPDNKVFPVRILPVNGARELFKPGGMLWVNLSNAAVAGTLGSTRFRLQPGKTAFLKPSLDDAGDYKVAVDCMFKDDSMARPLCRTVWRHDPAIRQIIFVADAGDRLAPRLWSVAETLRDEP